MAHMNGLCESGMARLRQFAGFGRLCGADWRRLIPGCCPLCAAASRGAALCQLCHVLVTAGMRNGALRCARCCLALGSQGPCPDCEMIRPAFSRIIAAFDYVAPADVLIHRLKVTRRFTDVPVLAGLLVDEVLRVWPDMPDDLVVVPVPASRHGVRSRGFNPAAELARTTARRLRRAYRPEILAREREGRKQAMLGRDARMMATSRLYRVAHDVTDVPVAVVDDVMTTGSTMHSIARMLKRSGARSVHGLVLARTPRFLS